MTTATMAAIEDTVERAISALSVDRLTEDYWAQNEFLFVPQFLPPAVVEGHFVPLAQRLKKDLNRNFIPGHKKGGSVSFFTVKDKAAGFLDLYRSAAFLSFLTRITKAPLQLCPPTDPHSCALYYYTEPGDHIGFHYDTSYYKGARYTILMGLVDRAPGCKLVCDLYKDDPSRETRHLELNTAPGDLVLFNGDKLWHAVTPLSEGEERVALTMEYVTNPEMGAVKRIYSNLKDAVAYFGLRAVFGRNRKV
jgi:hypothetical protein